MIESKVFFEPYKCSMEVLKNMYSHNFPMEKYIIKACNEIHYPNYNGELSEPYYYDDKTTKEELGLDRTQYTAFRAALTQELTIIQGPPGTGKTFIGLNILKEIINNLYRKPILTKPILVVCYTNHALDQFLEGILSFTKKVVRIGGQSKSKIVNNYNLKNINQRKSVTTIKGLQNSENRIKTTMNNMKYFKEFHKVMSYNTGILELSLLKTSMPKQYHNFFKTSSDLLIWLFQDQNYFGVLDHTKYITEIVNEFNKVFNSENLLEIEREVNEDVHHIQYIQKDIVIYTITLDEIEYICEELEDDKYHLFQSYYKLGIMQNMIDYFKHMLNLSEAGTVVIPTSIKDLNQLSMKQRWSLYFRWEKKIEEMLDEKLLRYKQLYTQAYNQYAELRELQNIELLKDMHVVALTTTGAAKHRILLEGLQSPIGMI